MTDQFLLRVPAVRRYLESNQLKLAEHELLMALAQYPDSPSACRLMGSLQAQLGNFRAASEWTQRYLSHCPTDSLALTLLASTREKSGELEQILGLFDRAEQNAKTYQDFFELSVEADRQGLAEIALRTIDKAISLSAGKPLHAGQVYLQRARILQTIGRSTDAAKIYRDLIRKNLLPARAWFALLDLKTEQLTALEYKALSRALEQATNPQDRALIGFALGKAHEDAANFPAAFTTFKRANDDAARSNTWNAQAFANHAKHILEAYAPVMALQKPNSPDTFGSELIFLVGLPRSGTTLVEQVLSAHPEVEGANELPHLPVLMQQESQRRGKAYPAWVAEMSASDWRRLGDEYLSLTARWRLKRPKSTDKLPENWLYIGAIERMFPGSIIIDCLRDPVETVWSCYKQLFAPGRVNFSYRFEDLRDFWLSYRTSMEVWGQRLPRQVYAQSYEMLVSDTEAQVRALLDFCGLAFSAACLQPHLAQRVIRTPSASQVRMPMHAPSVKTHGYGEHLASLRALFN